MLTFTLALTIGYLLSIFPSSGLGAEATTDSISASSCGAHPTSASTAPSGAVVVDSTKSTTGSFSNLTAALASLPSDSSCQTIFMKPGTYIEQVSVNRPGQTVIIGYTTSSPGKSYSGNQVTVSYSRGLSVSPLPAGHSDPETAVISTASSNVAFYNVNFINTDNLNGATANYVTLAASIYGSHIGFYGCNFTGWQDTLLTGSTNGYQYYESSYIDGAIDFIWGYSAAYFKGCTIAAKKKGGAITAHNRKDASGKGIYVFDQCLVTAAKGYESATKSGVYLGRPYSEYARVVVKNSYLDSVVQPAGWEQWSSSDPRLNNILFAEFSNTGPGNWENNAAARKSFGKATLLTSDSYTLSNVMDSTSWIDMTYWKSISTPSKILTRRDDSDDSVTTLAEADSTSPAAGDYIVSKTPIQGKTVYSTFAQAIAAIQGISNKETVTIFIYPGLYKEQIVFNRSGTTIFRGYSENPSDNTKNQVILQNSVGVDTQADQSNSDSATLYSRATNLQLFNINLNNVFGQTRNYASLGFASGNNGYTSFYGCQITGNQDTFDMNVGTSVFAYNTLVEGSIDFIWGAGTAYFLNSTIVPNKDGGSIAAMKRASSTTAGGLVFDQCTVAATKDVTAGSVFLGRPYNEYSRVAYIYTYLDASISTAGWSVWGKSDPRTDHILFGEYHNTGPGASTSGRATFSKQLSDSDVKQFKLANFFSSQGTSWIDMTYVKTTPF
ncbi:carbohydrate esterase family 8 protein [Annulohypoxylon maeteangense]|uniref:carbohydrate esterase family 8 protein n=1 Tax=Annulohypoxylon maeteangense TaxID=1927788 RepID=UPI002008AC90|nr:carbohydrate esterase family 8 protein [Annulohypoxylon maeteangense]KAI0887899.1 carbohydrate esterase family 8 protein [Annulohypoxylon maeteangense]